MEYKYKYFISYLYTYGENHTFGFGNSFVPADREIEDSEDIETIQDAILENAPRLNKVIVINFQLVSTCGDRKIMI